MMMSCIGVGGAGRVQAHSNNVAYVYSFKRMIYSNITTTKVEQFNVLIATIKYSYLCSYIIILSISILISIDNHLHFIE